MKIQSIIEDVIIATGIAISLVDIQQILSIILLVFNVGWILFKCGVKIYEKVKSKNYKGIADDIKDTTDELQTLSDSIKDDSEKKDK